jgi:uncharacterized protein YkwD
MNIGKYIAFLCFPLMFCSSFQNKSISIVKTEAQLAFEYLNQIRNNPAAYVKEFPFLKSTKIEQTSLRWNDTLAQVAEAKALEMAQKNYFSHTNKAGKGINILIHEAGYTLPADWIKPKSNNYFESIAAGKENGIESIKILLIDKGVPSLGHRKHLLGIGEFNKDLVDIGIGFVKGNAQTDYQSYCCIIIAKNE